MANKTAIMAIRMANKRVVTTPHGEQNGHYGRRMANKRVVTTPPHGKQKGRYDPIIRMSRNACENRQIVPFWLIFVTRLLRDPPQIADFRAIFLHKTGLLCKILSEQFTFWTV